METSASGGNRINMSPKRRSYVSQMDRFSAIMTGPILIKINKMLACVSII
jgi:hypothetical protein